MKNNPRRCCLGFPLQSRAEWTMLRILWFSSQHLGGASLVSPTLRSHQTPFPKRSSVSQPHITPLFPWDALCLDPHRPVLSRTHLPAQSPNSMQPAVVQSDFGVPKLHGAVHPPGFMDSEVLEFCLLCLLFCMVKVGAISCLSSSPPPLSQVLPA